MIKLKINNIEIETGNGSTVYESAEKAGIHIPVLCHSNGVEHYSSCMVCMVRDNASGKYIPSCTAIAQEGMDIDASGEAVISLRKKAVELLLSEHRAECEAPCRVVCPAGYNIPLMNRYLIASDFESASQLTLSEINTPEIQCLNCPGYCENACRRKKVDNPVSIRNIKIFIWNSQKQFTPVISGDSSSTGRKKPPRPFASHIGKLEDEELKQWLRESKANSRKKEILVSDDAFAEACSCMHCDCRAANDCRLRELADSLAIKDPRGKVVNSPIEKKINRLTGLIFENAKCIKCGLCVRICEDSTKEPALCFISRGFVSIITEPLTTEFGDVLKNKTEECINICPTGALSHFYKK